MLMHASCNEVIRYIITMANYCLQGRRNESALRYQQSADVRLKRKTQTNINLPGGISCGHKSDVNKMSFFARHGYLCASRPVEVITVTTVTAGLVLCYLGSVIADLIPTPTDGGFTLWPTKIFSHAWVSVFNRIQRNV